MTSNPLVSIIMPMKNASEWVVETIESIRSQTFEHWELVIVDDFSEDNSYELVSSICQKEPRIRVLKNQKKGIVPALTLAFTHVNGTYITRMDADDRMPENRLQQMVDTLHTQPEKTIVTGRVTYFSDETVSEGYRKYEQWLNERVSKNDFYDHIFRECIVASPNWMGRTEEFKKYRLLEELDYPEDYDLCFRWMQHDFSIVGIDELTLLWNEHPRRTSRNTADYQQKAFFRLKLSWFNRLYPNPSSVGIVGIGSKGKLCASHFQSTNYSFQLYDLNHEKHTDLFGKKVLSPEKINDEFILIARYPENLDEIRSFIESKGYRIGENAFWV